MNEDAKKIETTMIMCTFFIIAAIYATNGDFALAMFDISVGIFLYYRRFVWLEKAAKQGGRA